MTQTRQHMFDTALNGIRAQGGPAIEHFSCAYRASNGRKCAAGQVIPDEAAALIPKQDTLVDSVDMRHALTASDISLGDVGFLRELQHAHDNCAFDGAPRDGASFFEIFEPRMANLAVVYDLNYQPPA